MATVHSVGLVTSAYSHIDCTGMWPPPACLVAYIRVMMLLMCSYGRLCEAAGLAADEADRQTAQCRLQAALRHTGRTYY